MSWFKLLNEVEGTVKKVSADGKKMTVQTTPGQKIEIDTDKDPNIDIQQSGNQAVISLGSKNGPNVGKKIRSGQKVDIGESPDYRLQAQRDTMNLSDQAIVELVASLYKKIDQLGHREETDAEYFDDLYKRYPNENVNEKGDGNMEGYLATIDEYVEMLFKHNPEDMTSKFKNEIAYRIQNAVDDIRTRELGAKPSLIRAKYNKQIESVKKKD